MAKSLMSYVYAGFYNPAKVLAAFLLLSSCVTEPKDNTVKNLSPEEAAKLDEFKAELEIGRNMAGRLLQYYGQTGNPELIRYLNVLGSYVAAYSDVPERQYMFSILDTEAVNAFACPGGYILVTKGALRLADSEAELAMILGHEITHVAKQHMFKSLTQMSKEEMEKNAKEVDNKTFIPKSMQVRKRPDPQENEVGSVLARYMAGSAGAGMSILQAAKAGMSVILEKGLDKELEYEADYEGVKYGIRSGYEPFALTNYLKRLDARADKKHKQVLGKTHPTIQDRLSRIDKLLAEMQADVIIGAAKNDRFKKIQSTLPPKGED